PSLKLRTGNCRCSIASSRIRWVSCLLSRERQTSRNLTLRGRNFDASQHVAGSGGGWARYGSGPCKSAGYLHDQKPRKRKRPRGTDRKGPTRADEAQDPRSSGECFEGLG